MHMLRRACARRLLQTAGCALGEWRRQRKESREEEKREAKARKREELQQEIRRRAEASNATNADKAS